MTFKHINFQDSEIMRNFEQIAQKNGIIKQEKLSTKIANNLNQKINLTPSDNLMENIFNLSSALREQKLISEAEELEHNFLIYKKAQTLYQTSKETGDDFLYLAHPNGSHKLDGIDSDEGIFEDLIDKHLKIVQKIEKKPTGKLSNANSILKAVKTVLGQATSNDKDALTASLQVIKNNLAKINEITREELDLTIEYNYQEPILTRIQNPTIDNLQEIQDIIGRLKDRLNPTGWQHYITLGYSGLTKDTWASIQDMFSEIDVAIKKAIAARNKIIKEPAELPKPQMPAVVKDSEDVATYKKLLQQIKTSLTSDAYTAEADPKLQDPNIKEKVNAFITGMLEYIHTSIETQFDNATDKEAAAAGLIPVLDKVNARVMTFHQKVIS